MICPKPPRNPADILHIYGDRNIFDNNDEQILQALSISGLQADDIRGTVRMDNKK